MPTLRGIFKNTNESFQMRYCMQFFFQGHQNCQNLKIYTFEFTYLIKADFFEILTLTPGSFDAPGGKIAYSTSFESSH